MTKFSSKIREWWQFPLRHFEGFALFTFVAMMLFAWLFWGLGGGQFVVDHLCPGLQDGEECKRVQTLGAVGDIFGGVNALFAGFALAGVALSANFARRAFVAERQWNRDEKFSEQIQKSFQWAYDVLTDEGKTIPPSADRLKWLTSARHLLRAQKLMKQVKTLEWTTIVEDHEEFWRHKFLLALEHEELIYWGYYSGGMGKHMLMEKIEVTSAMVIIDFGNWRKGRPDPTDDVNREELIANGNPYAGLAGRGLQSYVRELRRQSSAYNNPDDRDDSDGEALTEIEITEK